jgi:hypothetical protein
VQKAMDGRCQHASRIIAPIEPFQTCASVHSMEERMDGAPAPGRLCRLCPATPLWSCLRAMPTWDPTINIALINTSRIAL